MIHKVRIVLGIITTLTVLIAGCAQLNSTDNAISNQSKTSPSKLDGTIASMKLVHIKGQNPKIKIYDMFYWSAGKKVEAYLTEPANPGPNDYPLLVYCHGGWVNPHSIQHYQLPNSSIKLVRHQSANEVTISPQYRGYANSQGTVQGILGNTMDTKNAIKAAESLKVVNPHMMNLYGGSMGGAIVLMLASDPQYDATLNSVIALSPFVGWDITGSWALKHQKSDPRGVRLVQNAEKNYGKFSTTSAAYKKRSPNIANINAPVLLLQGTGDTKVDWHTVQQFYEQMKATGKTVKLVLVPKGDHGLTHHQQKVTQETSNWLKKYR